MKSTTSLMQRFVVLAVMVFVAGLLQLTYAQQGQGQGRGMRMTPQARTDTLAKQLGITDTTLKAKIVAIYDKAQKDITAKRNELQGGDMTAMRAAMTEINDKANADIKALLTKEQVAKFEDILKAQAARMQQRMRNN